MTVDAERSFPVGGIYPNARTKDIVVQNVENEVLVYDVSSGKAHHLNETSSIIWKGCDGKTPVSDLAAKLSDRFGTEIGTDLVLIALKDLEQNGLLEDSSLGMDFPDLSRRDVLFRYAVPAAVLPVVLSLVAPASAQQLASCLGIEEVDCSVVPCCPGLICINQNGVVGVGICLNVIN